MGILSLLNDVVITHFGQTFDIAINFIGEIIKWLVWGAGSVGVGIILFSLILKGIVLPFDIMQRVSMRKQNQKMQENKEKLEKLQKQYANDKQKYNEKLMEFQKANGISMLSSCLPMILSLVIFFVAIGAFNSYSQYANISNYNEMVKTYNQTIEYYTVDLEDTDTQLIYSKQDGNDWVDGCLETEATHLTFKDVTSENKYIYLRVPYTHYDATSGETVYEYAAKIVKGELIKEGAVIRPYFVVNTTLASANAEIASAVAEIKANDTNITEDNAYAEYFRIKAREAVEKDYHESVSGKMSFLWIKNIWQTDAAYKHPVLSYGDFSSGMGKEGFATPYYSYSLSLRDMSSLTEAYQETAYNEVTKNLGAQKSEPNGYFILIALSIGTILLQQIVTMKTQKAQNQFSSVDGQGASQSKMMLFIMTGMFAIFSFMYSASFSIYLVTSNVVSLLSMLLINKIVDVVMEKKEREKFMEKHSMKTHKASKKDSKKK